LHGGSVSGTVAFRDGASVLLGEADLDAAGKAPLATYKPGPGSHFLTAVYAGSASVAGSDSDVLTQTVRDTSASASALGSSPNPSTSDETVTLRATVTLTHGGPVTGTVNFMDGTNTLGTMLIVDANEVTFSTSTLAAGRRSLTAVFAGNASDDGSTSATLTQIVNK